MCERGREEKRREKDGRKEELIRGEANRMHYGYVGPLAPGLLVVLAPDVLVRTFF